MDANDQHRKDSNSEDKPRNINPSENGLTPPSKMDKAQEKIRIKESELGRDQGQTPADEHLESDNSQMDQGTKDLRNRERNDQKHEVGARDIMDTQARKPNEIDSTDNRDHGESSQDWNAENNETGRHK